MPRAQITCMGKQRTCKARLQIELASGAGLSAQDSCPACGETTSIRYVLVQARLKHPNRVWVVRRIHVAGHGTTFQPTADVESPLTV